MQKNQSALHLAIKNDMLPETIDRLLKAGANVDDRDEVS